jgi:hypothetical protein
LVRCYICRLVNDYMGHTSASGRLQGTIYSSVNRTDEYMGPPVRSAPHPGIFIGDVSPMNVTGYIHRFHVTDEYTVTFIGADE